MIKQVIAVSMLFSALLTAAQGLESQTVLNGFQLGQYMETVEKQYGMPIEEKRSEDKWITRIWQVGKETKTYFIVEAAPPNDDAISTIQLYGEPSKNVAGLMGISLGSDISAVKSILGEPSEKKEYEEDGNKYLLFKYQNKNYSVELNDKGIVISIKLFGFEGFRRVEAAIAELEPLEVMLAKGKADDLLEVFRPDFEIYKANGTIKYQKSARTDLASNSALRDALFGKGGLQEALKKKGADYGQELRISEQGPCSEGPCCVWKFPNSKLIQEILFAPYAGKWRVYEVSFRN